MTVVTGILFILILGLLVFIHELGHFLVARAAKIKVQEFAFGFPPRLFSKLSGGTHYSLNLLPLGGYVKLLGEDEHSRDKGSYSSKPPATRITVVLAGVAMNLMLAWLLLTLWFAITIVRPPNNAVVIGQVIPGSPAAAAGLIAGDLLIKTDGASIAAAQDLARFTRDHQGQDVTFTVRRFGNSVTKQITLASLPAPLGVAPVDLGALPEGFKVYLAPVYALSEIWGTIAANTRFIGQALFSVAGGPKVEGELAGPIGIFGILSQMVSLGPLYLLRFIANLSLLVGFFNILPIPALDGGKAAFIAVELVSRRKVIREQVEQAIHFAGFVLLIGVLVLVTYQDIIRLVTRKL
ncbi:site-2 protease family protein [Candidatus Berkelbacteria bacterium]|nr:site-2 protease family protein [Candidatus Berkelbacteria bacterium]